MKHDFPECQQAEKLEMSVEGRRFMDSASFIGLPLKVVDVKFLINRAVAEQRTRAFAQEVHQE